MNGEQLYELFVRANLDEFNCSVDPWEDLRPEDQGVWQRMAEKIHFGIERLD